MRRWDVEDDAMPAELQGYRAEDWPGGPGEWWAAWRRWLSTHRPASLHELNDLYASVVFPPRPDPRLTGTEGMDPAA